MKQNLMNQTVILVPNAGEWPFTNPFWKSWRPKIHEFLMVVHLGAKQVWQKLAGIWILKILGNVIRSIGCVLFIAPPGQEKIEQARMQAMQYRNIF